MARLSATFGLLGCIGLQIAFAVVVAIVTSTQLDTPDACYLNASGSVCNFAYATAGFSLLFSLLLTLGALATLRAARVTPASAYLAPECASVAAFATFWWLVAAVTLTQRGKQASDAGMPAGAARGAVIALAWLAFVAFLCSVVAVAVDRLARARHLSGAAAAAEALLAQERRSQRGDDGSDSASSSFSSLAQQQFKKASFEACPTILELSPANSLGLTATTPRAPALATAV